MALIDYKIHNFSHEGRHVSADVSVYRGQFQDVIQQLGTTRNEYVRIAKVATRHYEVDVPRDMTRAEFLIKVTAYLNKKLVDFALANGHTVITPQQDLADYEELSNEVVT